MMSAKTHAFYRAYIDCLNRQDWARLGTYVDDEACHNGQHFGLAGYRAMLENDFAKIPDLHFNIALVVCEADRIAARLQFECSPKGNFLGLAVNGKQVRFGEHVIYQLRAGKIWQVCLI